MNYSRNQVDYMQSLLKQDVLSLNLLTLILDSCFAMEVNHVIRIRRSKGSISLSELQQGVLSPQQIEARGNF
jgi:hypothetical protein